jgi:hypothetical protein
LAATRFLYCRDDGFDDGTDVSFGFSLGVDRSSYRAAPLMAENHDER